MTLPPVVRRLLPYWIMAHMIVGFVGMMVGIGLGDALGAALGFLLMCIGGALQKWSKRG